MFDALSIAATGMQAQQLNVDTIANNIANTSTAGFKKSRVGFSELMIREAASRTGIPASAPASGVMAAGGVGVSVSGVTKVFAAGDLKKTDSPLDVAIDGEGFLEVAAPDGTSVYTRGGSLKVNRDGFLVTGAGQALKPSIAIPENTKSIVIAPDGSVQVTTGTQNAPVRVGHLQMVRFASPPALTALGDGFYRASESSGEPSAARPGEDGAGSIVQGSMEGSNVKLVDEMVNLMLAQRAYEVSLKVVQTADEMLGMVNNLRK